MLISSSYRCRHTLRSYCCYKLVIIDNYVKFNKRKLNKNVLYGVSIMQNEIKTLKIDGFKSIKSTNLKLNDCNILIGANGAGKSNFVQLFRMLIAMRNNNFAKFIMTNGGADSFLHCGIKTTEEIKIEFGFISNSVNYQGLNHYKVKMTPTMDNTFLLEEEREYVTTNWRSYGSPSFESRLKEQKDEKSSDGRWNGVGHFIYEAITNWQIYHFHDTSPSSPMRRSEIIHDNECLREDAANIAPYLLNLKNSESDSFTRSYKEIVYAVRAIAPFFNDFRLDIQKNGEVENVRLSWQQNGTDFPMQPYHLSDGTIRFICLATALLQPNPPSSIIIDEPELGLHPEAIAVLAELIKSASKRSQIIVSTQSAELINYFNVGDLIVVKREDGESTFNRLEEKNFSVWLEDYSIGDLWNMNIINGGTSNE